MNSKTFLDTRKLLIDSMQEVGIIIDENYIDHAHEDINISEFISDSLQMVSLIMEIENKFDIELPDELITLESFQSLNALSSTMCELIQLNSEESNV